MESENDSEDLGSTGGRLIHGSEMDLRCDILDVRAAFRCTGDVLTEVAARGLCVVVAGGPKNGTGVFGSSEELAVLRLSSRLSDWFSQPFCTLNMA